MHMPCKTAAWALIALGLAACKHDGGPSGQIVGSGQPDADQAAPALDDTGAQDVVTVHLRLDGLPIIEPPRSNIFLGDGQGYRHDILDVMAGEKVYDEIYIEVTDTCGLPFEVGGYEQMTFSTGRTRTDTFSAVLDGICGKTYLCVLPNTFPYYEGCEHSEAGDYIDNTCPLICQLQD